MAPSIEFTSGILSFPKLNETNYHAWSDNMKAALQAQLLWLIVTGWRSQPTEPTPNPPIDADQKLFTPSSTEYKNWINPTIIFFHGWNLIL